MFVMDLLGKVEAEMDSMVKTMGKHWTNQLGPQKAKALACSNVSSQEGLNPLTSKEGQLRQCLPPS